MGLDITAYEKIELAEPITTAALKERGWEHPLYDDDQHLHVSVVHEQYREKTPQPEGFYKHTGETHRFRAGAYSGYNAFRADLARLVGTTDRDVWDGKVPPAFGELIDFSDCEGTLKTEVCAKLAKDFAEWEGRAADFAHKASREWFMQSYRDWKKAFELAAKGGCVDFH